MKEKTSEWQGFERIDFSFEERECILIRPNEPRGDGKWLFKTEYFGAFPSFELEMLKRGYYVAHMKSSTRWCPQSDTEARVRFCDFMKNEYGLSEKCMPVGMSCGGMQAVYLAALSPQSVSALYLDAPVMNLLSCPCGVGAATNKLYDEFYKAMQMTVSELINYRAHPCDFIDELVKARIPIALVCGDSDGVVPYEENGKTISEAYGKTDIPFLEIIKEGCDHHPHGLEDNTPLIEFTQRYYG